MPVVSIITVCRNEAGHIRKTAESVAEQTYRDFEWLVQDGGSTDGTREILEEYRPHMARFASEIDGGVYDAMNRAARLARGDWLLFLNGGDALADPGTLAEVVSRLENHGEDVWVGACLCVWPDGRPAVCKSPPASLDRHHFYLRTVNHQSAFIGRRVFERFGPYDVSFRWLADYDFFVRCSLAGVAFRRGNVLVAEYDMTGTSTTMKNDETMQAEWRRVRSRFPWAYRVRRTLNDAFVAWRDHWIARILARRERIAHGE